MSGKPRHRADAPRPKHGGMADPLRVIVIGAGQAGLSAAYYLRRRELVSWQDFVVLDGNQSPGGAWADRWDSLTFGGAHNIHALPGFPLPPTDSNEPANALVPRYYGEFEETFGLPVLRPAKVVSVRELGVGRAPLFEVMFTGLGSGEGAVGQAQKTQVLYSRTLINATGTWNRPFVPYYPGIENFTGTQTHTRNYVDAAAFADQDVLVVGGGTSAAQFVQELARAGARPIWSTRGIPRWTATDFDEEWGINVEKAVAARTTAGLRPLSVVATTGIPLVERYLPDILSGTLISRGSIAKFYGTDVVLSGPGPDGSGFPSQGAADPYLDRAVARRVRKLPGSGVSGPESSKQWRTPIDAVLWATGFRHDIGHLAPLGLREHGGGIQLEADDVTASKHPGVFFTGYGASASTLGATRAGRRAAVRAIRFSE